MNPQVQKAVDLIKANGALIALGLVAIAVPVAGWYFGSSQRDALVADATKLGQKLDALKRAGSIEVSMDVPGHGPWSTSTVASDGMLREVTARVESILAGSGGVDAAAVRHNQGKHGPIASDRLGGPMDLRNIPPSQRSVFPADFHEALIGSYSALLSEAKAGMPPSPELVTQQLATRRDRVVQGDFGLAPGAALDEAQRKVLSEKLTATRLAAYMEQARSLDFYANAAAIGEPATEGTRIDLPACYAQVWALWIAQDMVGAVMAANAGSNSVLDAPIKRLLYVAPSAMYPKKDNSSNPAMADGGALPATGPNYAASFTGRQTDALADVVLVEVGLVLETAKIPAFVDALAAQNFIAILNLKLSPVDPFAAAQEGFLYGDKHCSQVDLQLETIWLREWTCPQMPDEVRSLLGASCGGTPGESGSGDGSGSTDEFGNPIDDGSGGGGTGV